ncbi:CDP-diacylglycerol--glycerol-3-phosphate 3-phosphatidyltransferase [Candidatus Phytoplasma rubi]|uniref:CDP-diacylglycerol--glycerol-3-phosphate 3-phosphatidyltransferase n=1 Tax=Candidatus Phytoplasma rubi TaxID=399025 RepID=A0ABY7BRM0_9MOLU|nr:CDP-alcohol phosphatidyltransferase family protein [Candidatus Phytoplasma rubi]WAN63324.1 CDP-diacylglycerol--glycerol-3-phosphate 3-phosphatidyltransferase [Candidatus Phytoplasma rubi]
MKKLIKTSANLITLFRIFLVFVMLPFLFVTKKVLTHPDPDSFKILFILIFILASITDFLDGYIAKKFKQKTIFGKFFDPIADKLLVIVSFFYIYILSIKNALLLEKNHNKEIELLLLSVLLINIIRDFLVTGVRLMAFEQKTIITASFLGKLKTIFTFISIFLMLISKEIENILNIRMIFFNQIFLIINIFLIIWSGFFYIIKNFKFIKNNF